MRRPTRALWQSWARRGLLVIAPALLVAGPALSVRGDDPPAAAPESGATLDEQLKVPEGSTKDLIAFIERVAAMRPTAQTRDELVEWIQKTRRAVIEAAEKLMTAEQVEQAELEKAAQAQLDAWSLLARAGADEAGEKLRGLVTRFKEKGLAQLAEDAELQVLASGVPQLLRAADDERAKLYEEFKTALTAAKPDAPHAAIAYQVVQMLDRVGDPALAATACRELGPLFQNSTDERVSKLSQQLLGLGRRLDLPGHDFAAFTGKTMDGQAFDLAKWQKKVVLVDFWATWCGPCVAELPNVRRNYEAYHERGFEVVGVSLDDDRGALERFLAENSIPWPTVLDSEAVTTDGGKSLSDFYGVTSIPTVILIGADGKVLSTHARGEELGRLLAEALGPAESAGGN